MSNLNSLSNVLTSVRNGYIAKKPQIILYPVPKAFCIDVLKCLQKEGFLSRVVLSPVSEVPVNLRTNKIKFGHALIIHLRYINGVSVLSKIKIISKPSIKLYTRLESLWQVDHGLGCLVLSTSKGVITDREARKNNTGGELICCVW